MLITGLQALAAYALRYSFGAGLPAPDSAPQDGTVAMAALLFVAFSVVAKLLTIGFTRTVFIDGTMRREPAELVKIGFHFFWRIIGIEIGMGLMAAGFGIIVFFLLGIAGISAHFEKNPQPLFGICLAVSLLTIARFWLLCPALVIVTDCGMMDSFGHSRLFHLVCYPKLLIAFLAFIVVAAGPAIISPYISSKYFDNNFIMAALAVLSGLLSLMLYLLAVRIVGEAYLAEPEEIASEAASEEKVE
jgi:hypothetical protein